MTLDWVTRTSDASSHHPHGVYDLHGGRHPANTAVLVILHGLSGGSQESYIKAIATCAAIKGMRAVVINNRGCAGSSLSTPQAYSAAWTKDVRTAMQHLRDTHPSAPMVALGYSLGANILAKALGEDGEGTPFVAACVVSNPYDLNASNGMMRKGLGPIYNRVLCGGLIRTFAKHCDAFKNRGDLPDWGRVGDSHTVLEFDDRHTRRVFGYESVEAYYRDASSSHHLPNVAIPLLNLVAADDFLLPPCFDSYRRLNERNPNVVTVLTPRGGHVAWHETLDRSGEQWGDRACLEFLISALEEYKGLPSRAG